MSRVGPTATLLMLAVIALVAAASLCAFDRHDDALGLHGCLPLVVATVSTLVAMPLLRTFGASVSLVPAPERSVFLDTVAPPPKRRRFA